jgi:septal ring factor EnvC (AmiA/AmiB activator)
MLHTLFVLALTSCKEDQETRLREMEMDTKRLKAKLRLLEMKTNQLEAEIEHTQTESEKLRSLCNEMIKE